MSKHKNDMTQGTDELKMNEHLRRTLGLYTKTMNSAGHDVKDQPHTGPKDGKSYDGPMGGPLMNWTTMLEAMDEIAASVEVQTAEDSSMETSPIDAGDTSSNTTDDKDLLERLNKIFTPILVMQGFENEINPQKITESINRAGVLTEKNVIQFDDATRMAQLIAACALLIQQKKNTPKYQMYAKAASMRNRLKLEMQKEEYDAAKALAQKYLVMVSTSNSSPVARDAATSLLPQTQH